MPRYDEKEEDRRAGFKEYRERALAAEARIAKLEAVVGAAKNAALIIIAIYEFTDAAERKGGAMSIEGVAACHKMLGSLKKQRPRVEKLVMEPLRGALAALEADDAD